jgi:hypothetical protein
MASIVSHASLANEPRAVAESTFESRERMAFQAHWPLSNQAPAGIAK